LSLIENNENSDFGLWIGSSNEHLISNLFLNLFNQFKALTIKRIIHTLRNKSLIFPQLILPAILLILTLISLHYAPINFGDSPELKIDLSKYPDSLLPFTTKSDDNSTQQLYTLESVSNHFQNQFKEIANVKTFNLNDRNNAKFCANKTIGDYLICLGRKSLKMLAKEHFIAADFSFSNIFYGVKKSSSNLKITGFIYFNILFLKNFQILIYNNRSF